MLRGKEFVTARHALMRAYDKFQPVLLEECFHPIRPSECDGVIKRAHVSRSRGHQERLPSRENTGRVTPSVFSSRFSVANNELISTCPNSTISSPRAFPRMPSTLSFSGSDDVITLSAHVSTEPAVLVSGERLLLAPPTSQPRKD